MGEKLYPPYIDGVLPALNAQTNIHSISFQNNRAVNLNAVSGMSVKITNSYTNSVLSNTKVVQFNLEEGIVHFTVNDVNFYQSDYYQIQLAYIGKDGTIGYYSTVGTVKAIIPPIVTISNLNPNGTNLFMNKLIGECNQQVYTYRFVLLNNDSQIVYDTGILQHTSNQNDTCLLPSIPNATSVYYEVTTVDNYTAKSPTYQFTNDNPINYLEHQGDNNYEFKCAISPNDERGSVQLNITYNHLNTIIPFNGIFNIFRCSNIDNYTEKVLIKQIEANNIIDEIQLEDFSIAQGIKYKYSLQQINKYNLPGQMIDFDTIVQVDFEDIFLIDDEHILKVQYNPKVSSFKTTIQESKVETLGSKYPFIFRNGVLNYKEFPIEGLISYHMDDNNLFFENTNTRIGAHRHSTSSLTAEEDIEYTKSFNLYDINIKKEREFKLAVLDWLNNGKPKVFKSSVEGNYIVSLMQVSLTPNDTLGRMLHTFKANALEAAPYNSQEYNKFNVCRVKLIENNNFSNTQSDIELDEAVEITEGENPMASFELKNNTTIIFPNTTLNSYPHYFRVYGLRSGTILQLTSIYNRKFNIQISLLNNYIYYNLDEPIKQIVVNGKCRGQLEILGYRDIVVNTPDIPNMLYVTSDKYNYLKSYSKTLHIAEQYIAPLRENRTIYFEYANANARQELISEIKTRLTNAYDRPVLYMYKNNDTYFTSSYMIGRMPTAKYKQQFSSAQTVLNYYANSAYIIKDMTNYDMAGFLQTNSVDHDNNTATPDIQVLSYTGQHGHFTTNEDDKLIIESDATDSTAPAIFNTKQINNQTVLSLNDIAHIQIDDEYTYDPRQEVIIAPDGAVDATKQILSANHMQEYSYKTVHAELDAEYATDGQAWLKGLNLFPSDASEGGST